MIYTITLNPAIDRVLKFNDFKINKTNRACQDYQYAAGKAIHVSKMLVNLQQPNLALYLSGLNDDWFEQDLKKQNINYLRFNTENGQIRQNIKLIDATSQTECNGLGLITNHKTFDLITSYLQKNLQSQDVIILSGSLPEGLSKKDLLTFLATISHSEINFIFDFSDIEILIATLKYQPLLIKPNQAEMAKIIKKGLNINDLMKMGAKNVFFSQGKDGGILATPQEIVKIPINKKFSVINSAGSGDSLIAGFASKFVQGKNIKEAIKFGMICGTATAVSEQIASLETVNLIAKELEWKIF